MPDFRIRVEEVVSCPEGTTVDEAGRRLILPDGRVIGPWIALELDEDRALPFDELLALGVEAALDVDRSVEPV